MEYNQATVDFGIQNGLNRVQPHFELKARRSPEYLPSLLTEVLGRYPEECQDRFVLLFAELATIAAVARVANQEPPLTRDDLTAFLANSIYFFNSFTHR
jgi:hypothetical protein